MTTVERPREVGVLMQELKSMLTRVLSINDEYDRLLVSVAEERDRYKDRVVELSSQLREMQKRMEEAEIGRSLSIDDRLDMLRVNGELKERVRKLEGRLR